MRLLVHIQEEVDSPQKYFAIVDMPNNEAPTDHDILYLLAGNFLGTEIITDRIIISDDVLTSVVSNEVYNSIW